VSDDFDIEPVPGLPELPPEGERILWQGSPDWRLAARRILHVDKLAVYFALLLAWRVASAAQAGASPMEAVAAALWLTPLAALAIAVLCFIAWLIARTTIYTITTARVAMRFGVALPMTVNLPFKTIVSADINARADGAGDLALSLNDTGRIGYAVLWPHARPWHFARPRPMFRCIPDVGRVGEMMADALSGSTGLARAPAGTYVVPSRPRQHAADIGRPLHPMGQGARLTAAE
jgi:Bacterial PH domain